MPPQQPLPSMSQPTGQQEIALIVPQLAEPAGAPALCGLLHLRLRSDQISSETAEQVISDFFSIKECARVTRALIPAEAVISDCVCTAERRTGKAQSQGHRAHR